MDQPRADLPVVMQFMTTEHFTLQTARGSANAEITGRLQLYMVILSSSVVALALVAQLSGLGGAFLAFALVLFPVVYFLGVVTLGRLVQLAVEWRRCGQGMGRIRHWYLEVAPHMAPYFVMPASDDPWVGLAAVGIRGKAWAQAFLTAPALVLIVNSVVAGVFGTLLGRAVAPGAPLLAAVGGSLGFAASVVVLATTIQRMFRHDLEAFPVAFPEEPERPTAGGR